MTQGTQSHRWGRVRAYVVRVVKGCWRLYDLALISGATVAASLVSLFFIANVLAPSHYKPSGDLIGLIEGWSNFYLVLATAVASLIGLLFVATSVIPSRLRSERDLHLLTDETLISFFVILGVAMTFLMHDQVWFIFVCPTSALAAAGVFHGFQIIKRLYSEVPQRWRDAFISILFTVNFLILFIAEVKDSPAVKDGIGGFTATMLVRASSINGWLGTIVEIFISVTVVVQFLYCSISALTTIILVVNAPFALFGYRITTTPSKISTSEHSFAAFLLKRACRPFVRINAVLMYFPDDMQQFKIHPQGYNILSILVQMFIYSLVILLLILIRFFDSLRSLAATVLAVVLLTLIITATWTAWRVLNQVIPDGQAPMVQWKYAKIQGRYLMDGKSDEVVIEISKTVSDSRIIAGMPLIDAITRMGAQGWELVGTSSFSHAEKGVVFTYHFKAQGHDAEDDR